MRSVNGFWWILKVFFGPDVLNRRDVRKMSWSIVEVFVKFLMFVFILGFFDEIHFDLVHALHNDLILFHEDLNFFIKRILCLGIKMIAWSDSGSFFFVNELRVWTESAVSVRFCGTSWSFLFCLNAFMLTVSIFYKMLMMAGLFWVWNWMMWAHWYVLFGYGLTWTGLWKIGCWLLMIEEGWIVDVLEGPVTERRAESILGINKDRFNGVDLKREVIILFPKK